jgi:DNA repair exonuclease SbcCD ATPase subunit
MSTENTETNEENENLENEEQNEENLENENENEENSANEENANEDDVELKKVKTKVDAAYKARDEALQELAEYKRKEREAETEKLRAEGKLQEAHEREMADKDTELAKAQATIKDLEKELTRITRDNFVSNALGSYEFRNQKARDVAVSDITKQLKKNDAGEWVHKDGRSINEFAKAYLESEDNSFLLKPKQSNGSGLTKTQADTSSNKQSRSLFGLPQSEVVKMAAEGKLPRR